MKAATYGWVCALVLLAALWLLWPQTAIQVSFNGRSCYLPGQRFALQWRHSVERQWWREDYRLDGRRLWLYQTLMQTFGAGTPSSGSPVAAPKGFVGQASPVRLPELNWVVSRRMQGEIHTNGGVWAVYRQVPDYTEIHIRPVRVARGRQWLGAQCHEP